MLKQKSSKELAIQLFVASLIVVGLAACGDDSSDPNLNTVGPANPYPYGTQGGIDPVTGQPYPPGTGMYGQPGTGMYGQPGAFPPGYQPGYTPWIIPQNYQQNGFFYFTVRSGDSWCRYQGSRFGGVRAFTTSSNWMGQDPYIRDGRIYVYGTGELFFR